MLDYRKRELYRKVFFSRLSIVVLLILLVMIGKSVWGVYQKEKGARENRDEALTKLEELRDRKEFLEEEIARLNTKEGVEREIREKFGVTKEGEKMIVIVDSVASPETSLRVRDKSLWDRFISVFRRD